MSSFRYASKLSRCRLLFTFHCVIIIERGLHKLNAPYKLQRMFLHHSPSKSPTMSPSKTPTTSPSKSPTFSPSKAPTPSPTTGSPRPLLSVHPRPPRLVRPKVANRLHLLLHQRHLVQYQPGLLLPCPLHSLLLDFLFHLLLHQIRFLPCSQATSPVRSQVLYLLRSQVRFQVFHQVRSPL